MDVTNRFVLDFAIRYAREHAGARILDFGCGAGALVAAGLAAGLNISGVDVYYGGAKTRPEPGNTSIREIVSGRIPFPDAAFGLVVNNQVMEHVEDLDAVLKEIHRVLEPGGTLLSIFPSRDVFREGHIGIPFSHWFARGSKFRFFYTWTLRRLGLGTWKQEAATCRQWALDKLRWIDTYTHYRRRSDIFRSFNVYFDSKLRENDYIRYRGGRLFAFLLGIPVIAAAAPPIFRKLAFLVIVSRKKCA